jgi:Trypsin-like peptidase domain
VASLDRYRLLEEAKQYWAFGRARQASKVIRDVIRDDNSALLLSTSWAYFSQANRFENLNRSERRLLDRFLDVVDLPKDNSISLAGKVRAANAHFFGHADDQYTKDGSPPVATNEVYKGYVLVEGKLQPVSPNILQAAKKISSDAKIFVGAILKPKPGPNEVLDYGNDLIGTGFIVSGEFLNKDWTGEVFVTCAHVVKTASNPFPQATSANEVHIRFLENKQKSGVSFEIDRLIWADKIGAANVLRSEVLDVAVFRLKSTLDSTPELNVELKNVNASSVFPLAFSPGHFVLGGTQLPTLGMPLTENALLYRNEPHLGYSCTTVAGNSGCPVFNEDGDLVGIHTGDPADRIPSKDQGINHAFSISAIRAAIVARPLP